MRARELKLIVLRGTKDQQMSRPMRARELKLIFLKLFCNLHLVAPHAGA